MTRYKSSRGGAHLQIIFEDREVVQPGFTAYAVDDVLRLPEKLKLLCDEQNIHDAEALLAFARSADGRVTLAIYIGNMDATQYHDACDSLERIIRNKPMKSQDLTPTLPGVDPVAETPTVPGVALGNETAAAE